MHSIHVQLNGGYEPALGREVEDDAASLEHRQQAHVREIRVKAYLHAGLRPCGSQA